MNILQKYLLEGLLKRMTLLKMLLQHEVFLGNFSLEDYNIFLHVPFETLHYITCYNFAVQ